MLQVKSVEKKFGDRPILKGISLEIQEGEFVTLLGASGSGKTTLLRVIAGFEKAESGEVWMGGVRIDQEPPYRRPVNTVFQNYALFPHLNVEENVAYGLKAKRVPRGEIAPRVAEALKMVKMQEYSQRKPARLSGGQQQRVALARALVNRPKVLLLDEPLSALDANLRRDMQSELKLLQQQVGITFLFVTHDQEEAMALSDRIALLKGGLLEQIGTPEEIYRKPASEYVAQFIGQTNLLRCLVRGGMAQMGDLSWKVALPDGKAVFSLRPECVRASAGASRSDGNVSFPVLVERRRYEGATDSLEVRLPSRQGLRVRLPAGAVSEGKALLEFSTDDAVLVSHQT